MVVRAAFLDRDGVINANVLRDGKPVAPTCVDELRVLPGVVEAMAKLKAAQYMIIVVTNQPDLSTGRITAANLNAIHAELRRRLPFDGIEVCPHTAAAACACRKPRPGMLIAAAAKHGICLAQSFMVGDRMSDIEAGISAGCFLTALISDDYQNCLSGIPDIIAKSLLEAVNSILTSKWLSGAAR
ncbi:MAG TPA: HAD family hydrolase [Hyphomicrobiaceae bacterium]|nr:HAD family hydrolase [Hyphomicrobiaceae bacterium]